MDERLSLKAVDEYSEDFASKVAAAFFSNKERITGPEILKLCSIHQVNLFVIRELLKAWQHEGQKLRSPFFDYNAAAVRDEMERFQNVLSNHILINKENFLPLLKKAVNQTIYLVIDPYDFFSDTLDQAGAQLKVSELKNEIRYLRINRPPLEKLVLKMEERKLDAITGKEAFGLLDQILEEVNFTPEDIDGYLAQFSQVLPLKVEHLYEKKQADPPLVVRNEPIVVPPVVNKPQVTPVVQTQPVVTTQPVNPVTTQLPQQQPAKNTVKSVPAFKRISSIKDSLTINQKFMFTKMLFKGDFEIFSQAVEKLDRLDNLNQAMKYFEDNYPEWDQESEEYEEFIELVEKRFA